MSSGFDRSLASSFLKSPAGWYPHKMWPQQAAWPRADSHIHLVRDDYAWATARAKAGTSYDEPVLYNGYCEMYGVEAVLVVSVRPENDQYVADAAKQYKWCRGMAAFEPATLTVSALENLSSVFLPDSPGKIAGIALRSAGGAKALSSVDSGVWEWIDRRRWLISQNNSGDGWLSWLPILEKHPNLRLTRWWHYHASPALESNFLDFMPWLLLRTISRTEVRGAWWRRWCARLESNVAAGVPTSLRA